VNILRVLTFTYVATTLVACDAEQAERTRAEKARLEVQRKHQCDLLTEIIDLARQRGRSDLFDPDTSWSCDTLAYNDDCGLKVELMVELASAGRSSLAEELRVIGRECDGEHQFALKYGMDIFRDHRKLVKEAEEYAAHQAEAEAMDRTPEDRDPPERGP
jgi:hypothetical protein